MVQLRIEMVFLEEATHDNNNGTVHACIPDQYHSVMYIVAYIGRLPRAV